jgi:hypothetical protein
MIYKCTSDQCNYEIVSARAHRDGMGWTCLTCGAEYRFRSAGATLGAEDQKDALKGILTEHAYYLGLAGLPFFELDISELLESYREGRKHRQDANDATSRNSST